VRRRSSAAPHCTIYREGITVARPGFVGINHFVDQVAHEHPEVDLHRNDVRDDSTLGQLGDLLGQALAWGPGPEGAGIYAKAEELLHVLYSRVEAAEAALEHVAELMMAEAAPVE
jgi:hypothetical protein